VAGPEISAHHAPLDCVVRSSSNPAGGADRRVPRRAAGLLLRGDATLDPDSMEIGERSGARHRSRRAAGRDWQRRGLELTIEPRPACSPAPATPDCCKWREMLARIAAAAKGDAHANA
jgi:hypothetical protein